MIRSTLRRIAASRINTPPTPDAAANHYLLRQFACPTRLDAAGSVVEVVDLQPKDHAAVPVVYIPGWLGFAGALRGHLVALAGCGFRVLAVESPVHGLPLPSRSSFPSPQLRKALPIRHALDHQAIGTCDVVGYSEGAITAAVLARLRPGTIRNLVLVSPAGLWSGDSLLGTVGRSTVEFMNGLKTRFYRLHDSAGRDNAKTGRAAALRCIREGPLQVVHQVLSITTTSLGRTLRDLQKRGINTHLLIAQRDQTFPLFRRARRLHRETGIPFDNMHSIEGTHCANTDYAERTAVKIAGILQAIR
jgi:pimeloyl-ACP methyl ester carboxylesterase